ncbi:hypothetical protein GWI33_000899 [Rhynchophorus ferrugineus]|uniref:Lipase domain-containing protein n=1 Tax=Rhynchophorus ferrugineus TaxID=354439 RepID=A0A834HKS3_RHYFE|nr:hypothetical protein GWI33_000899 [Rhynchophorus ferrugineus]
MTFKISKQLFIIIISLINLITSDSDDDFIAITSSTTEKTADNRGTTTKCFGELGCIKIDSEWYNEKYRPTNLMPADPELLRTEFLLIRKNYSKPSSVYYNVLTPNEKSIKTSGYKQNEGIFLLIHDFTSNGFSGWIKHLSKVLFQVIPNCNILSVDWRHAAQAPYDQAIANSRVVSLEVINMIRVLKKNHEFKLNKLHIVGHGIGAHIAGYVGELLPGIKKITGLDPSGPRFEGMPPSVRLDPTDATYVEVLHTDAFFKIHQGSRQNFGHTDFFINDADIQPGCPVDQSLTDLLSVSRNSLTNGEILPGCSHKRSYKYFIESLEKESCSFLGIRCKNFADFVQGICTSCKEDSCRTFGLITYKSNYNGSYFLQTASKRPYCLFQYKITLHVKGSKPIYSGYFKFILIDVNHMVTTSSSSISRNFKRGNDNSLVFYAGNPEMDSIKAVKIGWYEKPSIFCILECKQFINVEKVEISRINSNIDNLSLSQLCPKDGLTEIENGDYLEFFPCN